jgi:transcriptional regulator with XRE-family HTH domain
VFAKRARISRGFLSDLERGRGRGVSIEVLVRLCRLIGTHPSNMLGIPWIGAGGRGFGG